MHQERRIFPEQQKWEGGFMATWLQMSASSVEFQQICPFAHCPIPSGCRGFMSQAQLWTAPGRAGAHVPTDLGAPGWGSCCTLPFSHPGMCAPGHIPEPCVLQLSSLLINRPDGSSLACHPLLSCVIDICHSQGLGFQQKGSSQLAALGLL